MVGRSCSIEHDSQSIEHDSLSIEHDSLSIGHDSQSIEHDSQSIEKESFSPRRTPRLRSPASAYLAAASGTRDCRVSAARRAIFP